MTDKNLTFDDSGSLSSLLLKREAAASAVLLDTNSKARPRSATSTSTSSYQLVTRDNELNTPIKSNKVAGIRGEALSGGGLTGEKNANLMSILVDSKVASSTKKLSSGTTPRNLAYQLYFVTTQMVSSGDICGGPIASIKYDAFCAKPESACQTRTHKGKKHKLFAANTVFIIGKSNNVGGTSSDKIIHPGQYSLEISPEYYSIARKLIQSSNGKLFSVKDFKRACEVFNTFVDEFNFAIGNSLEIESNPSEVLERKPNLSKQQPVPMEVNLDTEAKRQRTSELFARKSDDRDSDNGSSSSSSDSDRIESDISFDDSFRLAKKSGKLKSDNDAIDFLAGDLGLNAMEEQHVSSGIEFSRQFEDNPIACIAMLGAHISKQETTITLLTEELDKLKALEKISPRQLRNSLLPLKDDIKDTQNRTEKVKLSVDKFRKKYSDSKLRLIVKEASEDIEVTFQDKFDSLQEEIEAINPFTMDTGIEDKLDNLELKVIALSSGAAATGTASFPAGVAISNPLIPDVIRGDISSIEFKLELLESRVGAETLRFGNITLKSLIDVELFVNDHVPSCSYGCFFDMVALLDSLRDTTTTEKSFLESEYNAQKTKFVSVDEASTSASFLHVAPLVFCGNSTSSDSKYGSIERSLPHVKSREHWVSLGGMEGMKRQLEEEVLSKVGSILEEIPMTLGDSKGADLAKTYLLSSQTCFNKFVNWTETFYQELLGNSQVTEKEAWVLILHCWMAFFSDLRQIRMACSNLSPGRHEIGSEGRIRIVGRYIWTMGRAIMLQNEYCSKQFRNHPSIATVINYHLFQHRVPMSLYKSTMGKMESEVKAINAWKAQLGRDMKDLKKIVDNRS